MEADSGTIWLPGGFRVGWGVSEVRAAFVTTATSPANYSSGWSEIVPSSFRNATNGVFQTYGATGHQRSFVSKAPSFTTMARIACRSSVLRLCGWVAPPQTLPCGK